MGFVKMTCDQVSPSFWPVMEQLFKLSEEIIYLKTMMKVVMFHGIIVICRKENINFATEDKA